MAFTNIGLGAGPRKRSAPPPPFGAKKPAMGMAIAIEKKPMGDAPVDHEAAEPPEYEQQEESGAGLLQAIDAICDRPTAAKLFAAIADALGGAESEEPPMGDMGDGAGEYSE